MNILLFNLATDQTHPTLGFAIGWIQRLASEAEWIHVITWRSGEYTVPKNVSVHSISSKMGTVNKFVRVIRFYRIAIEILSRERIDVVFAHMDTHMTVLSGALLTWARIPLVQWYAHKAVSLRLHAAHAIAACVLTPTRESFNIPSTKVFWIGHGIDTKLFDAESRSSEAGLARRLATVGRISPSKRIEMMLEVVEICQGGDGDMQGVQLDILGGTTSDTDCRYEAELHARANRLPDPSAVRFHGQVRPEEAAAFLLRTRPVFLNLSTTGSLDKAILEAMSARLMVLSSNTSFAAMARQLDCGSLVVSSDPTAIMKTLRTIWGWPAHEIARVTGVLAAAARSRHSLETIGVRIAEVLRYQIRTNENIC
jgi:glycosyltransferase involved in cell wall biosynthesis